jgi:hypothetical protein
MASTAMNLNPLLKQIKMERNLHRILKQRVIMVPNNCRKQKLLNSRPKKNNRRNAESECFSPKKKELNIDLKKIRRIRMKKIKLIIVKMTMARDSLISRMMLKMVMKEMNQMNSKTHREGK